MSYEDEKLSIALATLRETEQRCANDIGWLKAMKNKVMGVETRTQTLAENLEDQIILADTQVRFVLSIFAVQGLGMYGRFHGNL